MKTHKWLSHVLMRTSGSVGGAHRVPSNGTVRVWATRGILVLALALGSLGAAMSAAQGHGRTGRAQASAHQSASSHAFSAGTGSISPGQASRLPWMY
jgi:hypothetical protein